MTDIYAVWAIIGVLAVLTAVLLFFEALRDKRREMDYRIRQFDHEWNENEEPYILTNCRRVGKDTDDAS